MDKKDLDAHYLATFKNLYQQKTGRQLTDAEALEHFESLITLIREVYTPIPGSHREVFEHLLSQRGQDAGTQ